MADSKDTQSFFRKVVKFVANPATEWHDLAPRSPDARENELAKSELKAMVERKRRNDFVRKREFDMLRKVRREGLTSDQLAALGGSSRLDDSDNRLPDSSVRADGGVKAKIDEIEQQMVDEGYTGRARRAAQEAPTQPAELLQLSRSLAVPVAPAVPAAPLVYSVIPTPESEETAISAHPVRAVPTPAFVPAASRHAGLPPPITAPAALQGSGSDGDGALALMASAVEVGTLVRDPELDEAVIAFANADFDACERTLRTLTRSDGMRSQHIESWLALFDLYRAIGQQPAFESLALDYARHFGQSAPQWFSMPRLVAEAVVHKRPKTARIDGQVGWVSPPLIDVEAVVRLRSQTLQMPLPWVFDFSGLHGIDAQACARLGELFRSWSDQPLDMRWLGGDRLFTVLAESAPVGVRDADPAYWLLRLDALRMSNRPDQFDEVAIDYCVTYEVSPPSWERSECQVRVSTARNSTAPPTQSLVTDVSTSFVESQISGDGEAPLLASVELAGQLTGDIGSLLGELKEELGGASRIQVSCTRLIRVDFIAAGDLLNWVLARRSENRQVNFIDLHRLVALFFGAMGIDEHATIRLRQL